MSKVPGLPSQAQSSPGHPTSSLSSRTAGTRCTRSGLLNYIRHVDVPESEFAFPLQRGRQLRYLAVKPQRDEVITEVEFLKGNDIASPIIFAVTVETLR
ncbi:hypothetical protein GC176_14570 [bacterium]|nr:hypothetical protein [bacterium]